jgi:hypothetical protein
MIILPAFLLQTALSLVGGAICAAVASRRRTFLLTTLGAFLLAYLAVGLYSWMELVDVRRQTPVDSMADRLAYENRSLPRAAAPPANAAAGLISLRSNWETLFEPGEPGDSRLLAYRNRTRALQMLHENQVSLFVNSPGFGIARTIGPKLEDILLPEAPPIPLGQAPAVYPPESEATFFTGEIAAVAAEWHEEIKLLHTFGMLDFVHQKGFGYIKDRQHVYGFQSHRFSRPLALYGYQSSWRVRTLELVSLLKYKQPAVYLSKNLPRMNELRDAPTRALNGFESAALPRLERGDDLIIHSTRGRIRALGAVRATQNCLSCHEGKRGTLLGAFSYRFDPAECVNR